MSLSGPGELISVVGVAARAAGTAISPGTMISPHTASAASIGRLATTSARHVIPFRANPAVFARREADDGGQRPVRVTVLLTSGLLAAALTRASARPPMLWSDRV